jgi:hypothetical protein
MFQFCAETGVNATDPERNFISQNRKKLRTERGFRGVESFARSSVHFGTSQGAMLTRG